MKLRYLFATLVAALTIFAGCEKEADHYLEEVQVSSSYLSFPAGGGPVDLTVTSIADWSIKNLPEWISSSAMTGAAGQNTIRLTATAATETREDSFSIECAGKTQTINVIQVTEKVEPKLTPMNEVIAAGAGNFRIKGVVTKIVNTQYGNWYLNDGTTDANSGNGIYVYGTLDKKGNTWSKDPAKENLNCPGNPDAWEFAPGDILTVEGPYQLYNGTTPEMVDVTVVSIERSLIGVEGIELLGVEDGEGVNVFPQEGGSIKVSLMNKGDGFKVVIPEEAKDWLFIEDFGEGFIVLRALENPGGDRTATVSFTTVSDGITYSCSQDFVQKGAIIEISIAEFLEKESGDTHQYRITGVITSNYEADKNGQSFNFRDWSGTTLVYRLNDYQASGAGVGDIITVVGKRGDYKGSPQMVEGVYEKHFDVKEVSIAEFYDEPKVADNKNPDVFYMVTGTVKSLLNNKGEENDYGNLYITDGTNDLYLYGLYPGWGATGDNRKGFVKAAGIKVGDTLTSIGYKDVYNDLVELCGGIYFSHEEGGAPIQEWDYTPSDEYKSADNLWKPVDESHSITWFYNPNWAGELPAPETSFKESTYTVKLNEADEAAEWTSQMRIIPTNDFQLDPQKKYTFTCKVYSSSGTNVFFKMYENGIDWPESFETPATPNRIAVAAGETKEIKVEDFIPLATPQILLIDFANHGADNTIYVKDIVVKQTGEITPAGEWNYTPGAEYLADNNLWKANAAGNEKYYYYHCVGADWNGADTETTDVPFLTVKESTYELDYSDATTSDWQNQFFIFPNEGHFIPFEASKTYKIKVTMGANQLAPGFFKISRYSPNGPKHEGDAIWEFGRVKIDPGAPTVIESPDITGVDCENIILVMDFGGNPEGTKIYIKDITLVEVGATPEEPVALFLNEFDTKNKKIEIYNSTDAEVDMTGWMLIKNDGEEGEKDMFTIPAALAKVPAKGYAVFTCKQSDASQGPLFGLSGTKGFKITLKKGDTVIDEVDNLTNIVKIEDGQSWGRETDGADNFVIFDTPTIGEPNGASAPPVDEGQSVTEILSLEKGAEVKSAESLVTALTARGFVMTDGTKAVYVYTQNNADVNGVAKVGDKVKVTGSKTTYNGVHEVEKVNALEVVSSGNSVSYPEPKDITASLADYTNTEAEYITFVGTLKISGNFYNVEVDGADASKKQGSLVYPVDADAAKALDGKHLRFTGYFNGLSGSDKYVNIITTSIEEVANGSGDTEVSITIDGKYDDWADVPGATPASVFNAFKVTNDADNFYFYVETDPGSRLWEGGGYLYLYFDWDNDLSTGAYSGATGMQGHNYEAYTFMFIFEDNKISAPASNSEAHGMTLDGLKIAGSDSSDAIVKFEISIPRADFEQKVNAGDVIGINSYRSKDGGNVYFPGYVVK